MIIDHERKLVSIEKLKNIERNYVFLFFLSKHERNAFIKLLNGKLIKKLWIHFHVRYSLHA